jgi:glyoxylase-like metal-dependent hydrolase (beta-lactamase superfamily II)
MKVHHLNCATMRPPGTEEAVTHCLLVETGSELVLVDAGYGADDIDRTRERMGSVLPWLLRPSLLRSETAIEQVRGLGLDPKDVRNVILTHLDVDHVGGVTDFPWARVHLTGDEVRGAFEGSTARERGRFRYVSWARNLDFVTYQPKGEPWFGLHCARELEGLPSELLLVSLPGHSRGHAGVAVQVGERWLLHCGDAYFHHAEMQPDPQCPWPIALFQRIAVVDDATRRRTQERLRQLVQNHGEEVRVFCSHDQREYEAARDPATDAASRGGS